MATSIQLESLQKDAQAYFSRHETFHPRYGWLKKGFDKVSEDREVFLKKDAPVILGVGKNMVRAIRYWCYAFKVIEEQRNSKGRYDAFPTEFGNKLLGKQGWDPYLENPASLWYLHWKLLNQPCYATTWLIAFNYFGNSEFTTDDLFRSVQDYKNIQFPDSKYGYFCTKPRKIR